MLYDLILAKLYVKNSLRNSPHGATFTLTNSLAPAMVSGLTKVEIGGRVFGPGAILVKNNGQTVPANQISVEAPLAIPVGTTIEIIVPGVTLSTGQLSLTIGVVIAGAGEATATIHDVVR